MQRDLARLDEQIKQLFPGEPIDAQSNGKDVVLSGTVSSKDVVDKAVERRRRLRREEGRGRQPAAGAARARASNQVLLRVRFAEVSRSAMTELGASLFTGANGFKNVLGRDRRPAAVRRRPMFDDADPIADREAGRSATS